MRSKASGKGKGTGVAGSGSNVSDTPVEMTGPARKRYFSLPVSSHKSVNTHGRISSVVCQKRNVSMVTGHTINDAINNILCSVWLAPYLIAEKMHVPLVTVLISH
jgi:hypothetical protein